MIVLNGAREGWGGNNNKQKERGEKGDKTSKGEQRRR